MGSGFRVQGLRYWGQVFEEKLGYLRRPDERGEEATVFRHVCVGGGPLTAEPLVSGFGFRISGFGFRVSCFGCKVQGLGCGILGLQGFGVQG